MLNFLAELLADFLISPIISWLLAALLWLVRTGVLLLLYPFMLLTGWFRLWVRERGRFGPKALWQMHGHTGLHRFGWQEAALDVEYLLVTLLLILAGAGISLIIYFLAQHVSL